MKSSNSLKNFFKILKRIGFCFRNGQGIHGLKVLSQVVADAFYMQTLNFDKQYSQKLKGLQELTQGLHTLMSADNQFTYSVLIALDHPTHIAIDSALQLTAPNLEILVATQEPQHKMFDNYKKKYPDKLKFIPCDNSEPMLNVLAREARGNRLFIMGQKDLVRCDILYRYEQMLRLYPKNDNIVMYCKEYPIEGDDIPPSYHQDFREEEVFHFPYVFSKIDLHSMLIPSHLWHAVGGIRNIEPDLQLFDLSLRLDLWGAIFSYIPHSLYGYRQVENMPKNVKDLLQDYARQKKLDWNYVPGYTESSFRAIPHLKKIPKIQVIIPFKNQKDLTLRAVKSVLKQKGVETFITAVDNRSEDITISDAIKKMGAEVLFVDEPFNYSRLNNQALENTTCGSDYDLVLFMNNDVELEEGALEEMARWIDQPGIGIVGCRLNYPNGSLQHGGLRLDKEAPGSRMHWEHIEKTLAFSELKLANVQGIVEGVTAACVLMKKEVFMEVGGFDEIWYPIIYSDIALTEKLKKSGYHCFYTPYAVGVHHESISRKKDNLEDIEFSSWFYQKSFQNKSFH